MQKRSNKKALITGITGQDGYYLAKFLLNKNYEITGLTRDKKVALEKPFFNIKKNVNLIKWNPLDKVELRKI